MTDFDCMFLFQLTETIIVVVACLLVGLLVCLRINFSNCSIPFFLSGASLSWCGTLPGPNVF